MLVASFDPSTRRCLGTDHGGACKRLNHAPVASSTATTSKGRRRYPDLTSAFGEQLTCLDMLPAASRSKMTQRRQRVSHLSAHQRTTLVTSRCARLTGQ